MPFLIEDLTPRSLRVPNGPPTEHPNGAAGSSRLEVAVPEAGRAARSFAALITGTGNDSGTALRLGACELSLVTPEQEDEARHRLDTAGPGPSAMGLTTDVPEGAQELDRQFSHGVGIVLLRRN